MAERSVTLYCQENGSDKLYKAEVSQSGTGYVVNCWWGPRTGSMPDRDEDEDPRLEG